jgi:para-nitrobenzyl esterase
MDIAFKFNNVVPPKAGEEGRRGLEGGRPERFAASLNFAELWTAFARTGKPSAKGAPAWPAYNLTVRPSMRIDTTCEVIHDRFREELGMWRLIGRL